MPRKYLDREKRRILIRMMLDLHSLFMTRNRPGEETLVQMTIRLGEFEGRAMDATRIAAITKLPRTTVNRHLKSLDESGRIHSNRQGRRVVWRVPQDEENPEVLAFYDTAERIVWRTCNDLTKMVTSARQR